METKITRAMSRIKRECHELLRSTRTNMKCHRMVEVEPAEHVKDDIMINNGVIRMKVLMTRHQLRQMLKSGGGGGGAGGGATAGGGSCALEQKLHCMRRQQVKRVEYCLKGGRRRRMWRPALQSIPEDGDHIG